ncbi:MAG: intradiol ring-cleavage dioxygenase [Phycisphaerales bacterium JB043]
MRKARLTGSALPAALGAIGAMAVSPWVAAQQDLPSCVWCGAQDAPEELTWHVQIADDDEPGERIVLRGVVYETDGVTPASGVLLYAYHTDITGVYRMDGDETGNGRRHGALRGWLRTDEDGRYEIRTIRPASYPGRTESAHVHVSLMPLGGEEHWIDSFLFEGDPLISERERRASERAGRFGGIVELEPDEMGVLVGRRDLRLRQDGR